MTGSVVGIIVLAGVVVFLAKLALRRAGQCAHVLEAVLAWHGNLEERPAAAEMAREAADRAARREQLAAQLRQREATERGPCRRAGPRWTDPGVRRPVRCLTKSRVGCGNVATGPTEK